MTFLLYRFSRTRWLSRVGFFSKMNRKSAVSQRLINSRDWGERRKVLGAWQALDQELLRSALLPKSRPWTVECQAVETTLFN
jgi:hypothetical protein